jgi:hypothetical protein
MIEGGPSTAFVEPHATGTLATHLLRDINFSSSSQGWPSQSPPDGRETEHATTVGDRWRAVGGDRGAHHA